MGSRVVPSTRNDCVCKLNACGSPLRTRANYRKGRCAVSSEQIWADYGWSGIYKFKLNNGLDRNCNGWER
jgi:hypothetical protein